MCYGIALARSSLPEELVRGHRLPLFDRGGEQEVQFHFRDRSPRLPIWRDGRLHLVRWGNGRGQSRTLPRTGWTWLSTIREGYWRGSGAVPVEIPAAAGLEGGVGFLLARGIRGLLVPDERGLAVAYMVCEPSSHYYRVMTRSA